MWKKFEVSKAVDIEVMMQLFAFQHVWSDVVLLTFACYNIMPSMSYSVSNVCKQNPDYYGSDSILLLPHISLI